MPRRKLCLLWIRLLIFLGPYSQKEVAHGFLPPRLHGAAYIPNRNVAIHQSLQSDRVYELGFATTLLAAIKDDTKRDGICSSLDPKIHGIKFIDRVRELEEYKREHGDCLVPKRYEANSPLGNWVNKQRQEYRKLGKGEKSSLSAARVGVLENMGFAWTVDSMGAQKARNDERWLGRFDELRRYQAEHGSCRVPTDGDTKLRSWAATQRKEYRKYKRGEKSSLTPERMEMLDSISFEGTSTYEDLWEVRVGEIKSYKEQHGDCLVPITYAANPSLAQWVSVQRKNYKILQSGRKPKPYGLTKKRIRDLDAIGFVWNYREHEVERFMDEFKKNESSS